MAQPRPLESGDVFPGGRLAILDGERDRRYLSLSGDARAFALADIQAEAVLVVFLSSLCSACRAEMATYNELHRAVAADPALAERVRLLGICVSDPRRTAMKLRRELDVAFPLFADERGELFSLLHEGELPVLYLLADEGARDADGKRHLTVEMVRRGHIDDTQLFLERMKRSLARISGRPG